MVALEAAAVGTPVVGFAVGGLADSGLATSVPPEDVVGMVEAALRLVRDPGAHASALGRARARLASDYAPPDHAAALRSIYGF
jgi:glycosyltransferase involved in cell wall biosynthesis